MPDDHVFRTMLVRKRWDAMINSLNANKDFTASEKETLQLMARVIAEISRLVLKMEGEIVGGL
jgi:hypothetical protein